MCCWSGSSVPDSALCFIFYPEGITGTVGHVVAVLSSSSQSLSTVMCSGLRIFFHTLGRCWKISLFLCLKQLSILKPTKS